MGKYKNVDEKDLTLRLERTREILEQKQEEVLQSREELHKIEKQKALARRAEKYKSLEKDAERIRKILEIAEMKVGRTQKTVQEIQNILEEKKEQKEKENKFFEDLPKEEQIKKIKKEIEDIYWKSSISSVDILRERELRRILTLLEDIKEK